MVGATELLRSLVRIPSVNPVLAAAGTDGTGRAGVGGDAEGAVAEVLRDRLAAGGLEARILTSPERRPSMVARIPGPTDAAPLVLLSHLDVVPADAGRWRHDPFGGEIVEGQLWGRGALDMKAVAVMHAEAVLALASSGRTPTREVVVVAAADEEAGGSQGTRWLVDEHAGEVGLRAGAAPPEVLGEGGFGVSGILRQPVMPIMLGEKSPLVIRATASGSSGHGAMPPPRQALPRLARFVAEVSGAGPSRLHRVVREQFAALAEADVGAWRALFRVLAGPGGPLVVRGAAPVLRTRARPIWHTLSDTVTPTRIEAGSAHNVVPPTAEVLLDCRLLPDTGPDEQLRRLRLAGRRHDVAVSVVHWWPGVSSRRTPIFDLLRDVSAALPGSPLPIPSLTPGTTDLRFFRARGAAGYGWVPLVLSPELLATFHGVDERLPLDGFVRAVGAMTDVVRGAAS